MEPESRVQIVEHGTHAVVCPRGYLNGPAGEEIDAACGELLRRGTDRILINFAQVETINTMGIANLVSVLEKIGRRNGVVCFSNLGASSRQIFDVLDISRAVLIFDDEPEALAHLCGRPAGSDRPHDGGPAPAGPSGGDAFPR